MHSNKSIIVGYAKANFKIISATLVSGFFNNITSILIPVFLGKFYQLALHTHSTRGKIFDFLFGQINGVDAFFIFFALLIGLKFICSYFEKYFSGLTGELFVKTIREQLFNQQLITKLSNFHKKETGLYLLRYSGDLASIQNYLTKGIINFLNDCVFVLLAFIVFGLLDVKLACILLLIYPLTFIVIYLLNQQLKQITRKRRNTRSVILSFVASRLNGILTLKILNRESIETEKYNKISEKLFGYGKKYYKLYALIYALLPFLLYSMLGLILIFAYKYANTNSVHIDISVLLVFIMLMINTLPVFKRLLRVNFVWQAGDVSFRKLLLILNSEVEQKSKEQKFEHGEIHIQNVSFITGENVKVLDDFSATIKPYTMNLIRGNISTGKNTLFKLLTGLYKTTTGKIYIDQTDINNISPFALRRNVTLISDEMPLIGKTIFEAISYSRKNEKRHTAFNMLSELGFSSNNENSILDKTLFEGGKNISAGERKLLKIARGLLTSKKIILLDDPFVNLDKVARSKLAIILQNLKSKHTIIIIDRTDRHELEYDLVIDLNKEL